MFISSVEDFSTTERLVNMLSFTLFRWEYKYDLAIKSGLSDKEKKGQVSMLKKALQNPTIFLMLHVERLLFNPKFKDVWNFRILILLENNLC